jgi:hypothetical protein
MISSAGTSSTRRKSEDQWLTFNCYQFSRRVTAGRPRSRRWVSADQCLCTHDPDKILDATLSHRISFREVVEEEETQEKKELEENSWPPDHIGVFRDSGTSWVNVPSDFMDHLWAAAIAADGVLRSIELTVQRQPEERWAIFGVLFTETMGEPFEVQYDRRSRPIIAPPRAHPVVRELRAVRAQLKWRAWSVITIIVVGVLVALWIANLWR